MIRPDKARNTENKTGNAKTSMKVKGSMKHETANESAEESSADEARAKPACMHFYFLTRISDSNQI